MGSNMPMGSPVGFLSNVGGIDLRYTIYQRCCLVNVAHARRLNAVHIFLCTGIFVVLRVHFTFDIVLLLFD